MNQMTQAEAVAGSPFKSRYDNFIGGKFVPPVSGRYFDNVTPITGDAGNQVSGKKRRPCRLWPTRCRAMIICSEPTATSHACALRWLWANWT